MKKPRMFNILKYKEIPLGSLNVKELTILEYKPWFSIKLFYFCKGECQDRFHTHSFKSYSFRLWGDYIEELIPKEVLQTESSSVIKPRSRKRLLFIPQNRYHKITKSNGCCTMLVTGPWDNTFKELKGGIISVITHGRRVVNLVNGKK